MQRNLKADFMRAVAISAVVFTHAIDPLQKDIGVAPPGWLWTADIYISATRFCVPLFFMLSGWLLLDKREDAVVFYKKRLVNIMPPFLAWSVFYFILRIVVGKKALTLPVMFNELLHDGAYFHLWFVYTLLALYLVTPLLRPLLAKSPKGGVILMLTSVLYAVYSSYYTPPAFIPVSFGYLCYYLAGHYINAVKISKLTSIFLLSTASVITALSAWMTFTASMESGAFYPGFYGYLYPGVIILSVCVFMLLVNFDVERFSVPSSAAYRTITALSKASFGTYLMHPVVLSVLQHNKHGLGGMNMGINELMGNPAVGIPVTTAITLAVCTGVVLTMKRSRLLGRLV